MPDYVQPHVIRKDSATVVRTVVFEYLATEILWR